MILKIFTNTLSSLLTDINGRKEKFNFLFAIFSVGIPIISIMIFIKNWSVKLFENSAIFASLLSLFIGLIFGVLMKIPDKLTDLKISTHDSDDQENKKNQAYNFLVSFRDYLSFNIVLAIMIIGFIVFNNFFPGLSLIPLSDYYAKIKILDSGNSLYLYFVIMVIYRLLLIWGILSFLFFLVLTISNLYQFTLYEFKKNYK